MRTPIELIKRIYADKNIIIFRIKKVWNYLINYLKATEIEVGLLLNFGKKPEFKRKIFTNKST